MIIKEIAERRSIRKYLPRPIPREATERLLQAALLAPTARNQQDFRIVVVTEPAIIARLAEECSPHQPFLKRAGAILAACATNTGYIMRCGQHAYPIDLAIVLDHISLQAVKEGLGSCWIGSFDEDRAREVLAVPDDVRIVQLMSLGFPDEQPAPRPRKPAKELFAWQKWQTE